MTNKTLKEKIEKILDPLYRYVEGEGVEWGDQEVEDILSLIYSHLEKKFTEFAGGTHKKGEFPLEDLEVFLLSEIKQILKQELLDK